MRASELVGEDFGGASLVNGGLEGANLYHANLAGASLIEVNLIGIDLKDAALGNAYYNAKIVWPKNVDPGRGWDFSGRC